MLTLEIQNQHTKTEEIITYECISHSSKIRAKYVMQPINYVFRSIDVGITFKDLVRV